MKAAEALRTARAATGAPPPAHGRPVDHGPGLRAHRTRLGRRQPVDFCPCHAARLTNQRRRFDQPQHVVVAVEIYVVPVHRNMLSAMLTEPHP